MKTPLIFFAAISLVFGTVVGGCSSSSNDDNSPGDGGGGQICTNDAGVFPVLGAGTCNGTACGLGCSCVAEGGNAACHCTGARPPGGGQFCVSANCGTLTCGQGCTCTDKSAGTCECPVDAGPSSDSGTDADLIVNLCEAAGGQCVALVPNPCPTGYSLADSRQYPCTPPGAVGVTCCLPDGI